jgi:TonB family protein
VASSDSLNGRVLQSAAMFHPIRFLLISFLLTFLGLTAITPVRSQDRPNTISLTVQNEDQLRDLAGRILQHADKAGCRKSDCTILVTDFTGPSGSTSVLGMQLADTLSSQLVAQTNGIRIVDRSSLQVFLERERISSRLLEDDHAAGWLASELYASAVLLGTLMKEGSGLLLHVQLWNAQDALKNGKKQNKSLSDGMVLSIQAPDSALAPAEPFASESHADSTSPGEGVFRAGANGVTMPTCSYRPDPQYTDAARAAKFNGTVLLELLISTDGSISIPHILRGAPFGLNEAASRSVSAWRCKPASKGGTLVPTLVPVEITYHLN